MQSYRYYGYDSMEPNGGAQYNYEYNMPLQYCANFISASFMFCKIDSETGIGLPGATFELLCNGTPIASSTSYVDGTVCFCPIYPGNYTLMEVSAPSGFQPYPYKYHITVDSFGQVFVDGMPARDFKVYNTRIPSVNGSFTATNYDMKSENRLSGGVYVLLKDMNVIATATSNTIGEVTFGQLPPGMYLLAETKPPAGYKPNRLNHTVIVAENGAVTIDGQPAEETLLGNEPIDYSICFTKQDPSTGMPQAGAIYEIFHGMTYLGTLVSDAAGRLDLGRFAPETYTFREISSAPGFPPDTNYHTIVIGKDGSVSMDGIPQS